MKPRPDLERVVEFKLLLAQLAHDYAAHELEAAARRHGRRLPRAARAALRTGSLEAVARLPTQELLAFASRPTWNESVRAAVASGHWARLIQAAVRLAFPRANS